MNTGSSLRFGASILGAAILASGCVRMPTLSADFVGIENVPTDFNIAAAYASTESLARRQPGQQPPPYRVGPNDELTIYVLGRDDLGSQIPVNAAGAFGRLRASIVQQNGEIVLPLLGPVNVAGKTIEEVRQSVQSAYAQRIASSNVDIIMQKCGSQPVHVTGAVEVPSTYYLCNNMSTLNDVLTAARWLTPSAFHPGGVLTRNGRAYQLAYPLGQGGSQDLDILLEPNDSIYFPTIEDGVLPKVHVFGEVETQGTFPIPANGMTLVEALGLARGLRFETASVEGVYLMRIPDAAQPVTYRLSIEEVLQGPSISLAPNDRIYVAPRNLARWDAWWRMAVPLTLSVRAYN